MIEAICWVFWKDNMDANDGSSGVTQPAQDEDDTDQNTGLLGRLAAAFRPLSTDEVEQDADVISPSSARHGMVNLRRMRVEDVAIPKAEIEAVPEQIEIDELVHKFRQTGFTRLPVFSGTLDTPNGFVHLKDLALSHGFNESDRPYDLAKMLRPLLFVPPSMSIGVLLTKMQAERRHMALVIDEYGGVDGLVTIEDLIEQVIGEIEDEHDSGDDVFWSQEKPGQYMALAKAPLDAFEADVGVCLTDAEDLDTEEIETLGGLVFMLAGQVPARGEVVMHPDGTEFEVIEADPRRIKRLRVRLSEQNAAK